MSQDSPQHGPPLEQLRYARLLDFGMKAGLAILIASFGVYIAGWVPAHVSFEDLPRLWALPVGEFLRSSGMVPGWGWSGMLSKGDVLALTGVVLLAGVSLPCLALLALAYARNRDWTYFGTTLALMGVLLLAALGVFTAH